MDGSPSSDDQYCSNCGERISRSANYCHYCGERLDVQSQRPASPESRQDGGGHETRLDDTPAGDSSRENVTRPEWRTTGSENPLKTVLVALALVVGGFVSGIALSGIALGILSLLPFVPQGVSFFLLLLFQFAGFVVFGLGYLRWRGLDRGSMRQYLGVDIPSLREIGLILVTWIVMIIAAGVVAQVVMLAVTELFGSGAAEQPAENPVGEVVANNPEIFPAMILFMFLVVGPAEELLFRGVVQGRLRERLGAVPAIVTASAVFASAHVLALWGQDPVAIAMTITILFVPSLGFGAIYEYTGNIVVPALLHGFHNSVVVTIVLLGAQADIQESAIWLFSILL
jgi:membrane protease YdiL (CAAX protease family)